MKTPRTLALLPAVFALLTAALAFAGTPAGDVLLSVGPAWLEAGGQRTALARGQQVEVGHKLITREGGHIHVRMKDGGLVAVRPNSELEIQVFDYDPTNPKAGKVRYSLRQGIARSVTGAIGEANKEAFRFNTPVAAIGVRGTDFIAFSDAGTTRVSVKSGAIVVAALSDICKAEGFGACLERAVALRAGDSRSYIEINQQDHTPRLLQGNQLPDRVAPPHPTEPVAILQESRPAFVTPSATNVVNPIVDIPVAINTGSKDVYWGRWNANIQGIAGATMAELLATGKSAHVTSTLFGLGVTQKTERLPDRWQAQFQLTGGEAYVLASGAYTPATLANGTLNIDMATRAFTAAASVKEGLNTHSINAAGEADWRGYLLSNAAKSDSKLVGIVNADLNTVGSVFEKNLSDGRSLTGTMIWHR